MPVLQRQYVQSNTHYLLVLRENDTPEEDTMWPKDDETKNDVLMRENTSPYIHKITSVEWERNLGHAPEKVIVENLVATTQYNCGPV